MSRLTRRSLSIARLGSSEPCAPALRLTSIRRRQRQLCVGGMAVVADETDLAVAPLEPHCVARLRIGTVFEDRDHLPTLEPGRCDRYTIDLGVQCEEQTDIRTAEAKRAQPSPFLRAQSSIDGKSTKRSRIVSPRVRSRRCVRAETTAFDVIPLTAGGTRRDNSRPRQRRDTAAFMAATVCDTIESTPNIPNFAVDLVGSP
jgi:hypothetical protein